MTDDIRTLKRRIADARYIIGCAIYFNDSSDYLPALYSAYRKLGGNDETIDVDIPKEIHDEDGRINAKYYRTHESPVDE